MKKHQVPISCLRRSGLAQAGQIPNISHMTGLSSLPAGRQAGAGGEGDNQVIFYINHFGHSAIGTRDLFGTCDL